MRRLIEHQVAVRAFGALNLLFWQLPRSFGFGAFFIIVTKKLSKKMVVDNFFVNFALS